MNVMVRSLLLAPVLLMGCGRGPDADVATQPTARVQVEIAAMRPARRTLAAYGTVAFAPQSQQVVSVGAAVVVEEVMVVAGQDVVVGQPLLRVRATPASALEWSRARTDHETADRELQRVERLLGDHLATNSDLSTARQAALNAKAALDDAVVRGAAPGSRAIVAPRNLSVASVDVSRGDVVAADAPLLHLGNSDALEVRLGIEPADLPKVARGQPVMLQPSYASDERISGEIVQILRQVDPQARLSQALVRVPTASALLPGSTVRAQIELSSPDLQISLPRTAVLLDSGKPYVFVVHGDTAKRLYVAIDDDAGTRIAVRSGIRPGDRVVVQGNYELEDGMKVLVDAPGRP